MCAISIRQLDQWDEVTPIIDNPANTVYRAQNESGGGGALIYHTVIKRGTPLWRIEKALHAYKALADGESLLPVDYSEISRRSDGNYDVFIYSPLLERMDAHAQTCGFNELSAFSTRLVHAVAALHEHGIVHGNICDENLFIDVKRDPLLFGQVFPHYLFPYIVRTDDESNVPAGYAEDVYKLGHMLDDLYSAPLNADNSGVSMRKFALPHQAELALKRACAENAKTRFSTASAFKREWDDAVSRYTSPAESNGLYPHLQHYMTMFDSNASMVCLPVDETQTQEAAVHDEHSTKRRRWSLAVGVAAVLITLAFIALYVLNNIHSVPHYEGQSPSVGAINITTKNGWFASCATHPMLFT